MTYMVSICIKPQSHVEEEFTYRHQGVTFQKLLTPSANDE